MNQRPRAQNLLAIARDAFTSEILPALPEKLRYAGLMIANAMAIAQREIAAGEAPARAEYERLRELFNERAEHLAGDALHAMLARYNQRLASGIRTGRFDDEERAVLLDHLRRTTADKLAVSNPRALNAK